MLWTYESVKESIPDLPTLNELIEPKSSCDPGDKGEDLSDPPLPPETDSYDERNTS